MKKLLHCLLTFLIVNTISAAVFQFSIPVTKAKEINHALIWIPQNAPKVRGVIMAGMTLMEREFVKDEIIRRVCADENLAIIFLNCGLSSVDISQVLADLSTVSGYDELVRAPLFFVGHSAGGPQAKACAIKYADRCFGLVLYRGGTPGGTNPVPPGIPVLMMLGQFDEFGGTMRDDSGRETWEGGRDQLAAFRAADERNLGCIVVEPGAGHFGWSKRNADYLALFIRKAAQSLLTSDGTLRPINHRSGWLTELPSRCPSSYSPACYEQYSGPKTNTSWHFDEELARATINYHKDLNRKRDQFIRWADPVWVDAGARHFFTKISWVDDGQTFELHPVYSDKYPGFYNGKGPRWIEAGKPVGHSEEPIFVKPVGGPVIAVNTNRLRIQFDALAPAGENVRVTFMAYSMGDSQYRYTEQVGMLPRGFFGLKSGKPQKITFSPLPHLKTDSPPVRLNATSDACLPVEFYVAYGPAIIKDGYLYLTELPIRAKYPIELKVVAWQFGRAIEPLVQTANPVEQTTYIDK